MTIHVRNEPTDASPAVVAEALHLRTDPAFVQRAGFERCPRCKRFWPSADFRPDRAARQAYVRSCCRDCRAGLRRHDRQQAEATGICQAWSCTEPIVEHPTQSHQCPQHAALSASGAARARARARVATASPQTESTPDDTPTPAPLGT